MWLAETAADTATLEVLAADGDRLHRPLAPTRRRRPSAAPLGRRQATGPTSAVVRVDPTRPYRVRAAVGPLASRVLLRRRASRRPWPSRGCCTPATGSRDRLLGAFPDRDGPALVNIATDGESYGHHHRHGEMALAQALHRIDGHRRRPADQLRRAPRAAPADARGAHRRGQLVVLRPRRRTLARPTAAAPTARPAAARPGAAPLRDALDWLRDELAAPFETARQAAAARPVGRARRLPSRWSSTAPTTSAAVPRAARRTRARLRRATVEVLRLLELQRHAAC